MNSNTCGGLGGKFEKERLELGKTHEKGGGVERKDWAPFFTKHWHCWPKTKRGRVSAAKGGSKRKKNMFLQKKTTNCTKMR